MSPTISYKVTDKWSVAAGARFEHVTFHQRRIYQLDRLAHYAYGPNYLGRMRMRINANNDFDVGYLVGTTYDITEDFSVGAVWRSRIRCDLEGNVTASGSTPWASTGTAHCGLRSCTSVRRSHGRNGLLSTRSTSASLM